ncbi:MAG: hypothetical protein AYP45_13865 [Candidatus Brocadia carolinensis]|uniref:Helicase/UvrB N-terminal domain-containing protein n=1 Tax=Candidatus Brocadia carolinensis TaxID=1004156 RepID=A0A1V4AR30_9BACT|nr:MAG: hypothetical protein AYP45_13865 [Candidatus Brocadia caroliniensis]
MQKFREGEQKMLVHMATGLGKTRTMVVFIKAILEYNMARRVLFVVDRIMLADQALHDGFSLISKEFSAVRITSSNCRQYKKRANSHSRYRHVGEYLPKHFKLFL